jgi:hypothetical protein
MFDPNANKAEKAHKAKMKKACAKLQGWGMQCIPQSLQANIMIDVKDVQCGDPDCAPIDTVFTLVWSDGGRGVFGMPYAPDELEEEDLKEFFPDEETLTKWKAGKVAPWPPKPPLRFDIGDRVECRVGPHPVKGWAPGRVIQLNYSEPDWPPNMEAPYQIALQDGRLIFAPQDTDMVIRLRPPAAPDAPSSPEYPGLEDLADADDGDGEMEEGDFGSSAEPN